jgi:hypothetical protein
MSHGYVTMVKEVGRTEIMESRMKPAAAASKAAMDEYTSELTELVVNTKPAARKPTIYQAVSSAPSSVPASVGTYRNMVCSFRVRCNRNSNTDDAE